MRWIAVALASLTLTAGASAVGGIHVVSAHGILVWVPAEWHQLEPTPSSITDPQTLLVVGTAGVGWNLKSVCQIAAYRVPATGAVVVIVGWRTATSGGGDGKPTGRGPLMKLLRVSRPSFECYSGRGAAASLTLGRKAYQVNVMVGDRTTPRLVSEALAVARSFDVSR